MEAIQATILDITHQDGPYILSAPGFAQQGAVAGSVEISNRIKEQILSKGKEVICDAIFKSLRPGHPANLHSIVKTIYQLVKDSNGNRKLLSIKQYDANFMAALQPCIFYKEFKADYAHIYLLHSSPKCQLMVKEIFPGCQNPTPLDSRAQRKKLQHMTAASRLQVTQTIANQSVQSYATQAGAFPSQAKRTLGKYKKDERPEPAKCIPMKCFGCGATDHVWYDKTAKAIVSPKKNDPGILANADKEFEAFKARIKTNSKKHCARRSSGGGNSNTSSKPVNLSDFESETQARIKKQCFASQVHNTPPKGGGGGPRVLHLCPLVLTVGDTSKPTFPISLQSIFLTSISF